LLKENANNPGSLRRQNFQLVKGYGKQRVFQTVPNDSAAIKQALGEYHLVQASGKNNALGKYRFNIKNFHSVYLHDTPTKKLFNKSNRALSHGCVRLQSASQLARLFSTHHLLANTQDINTAIHSTQTQHFALAQSMPVYLTYQTVMVTSKGEIHWNNDIYQLDKKSLHQNANNSQSDATVSNVMLAQQ
jgi:murein L,D-transpeptidase YcbB/YkuD